MCRIDHVPFRFSRGGVAYTFINDPTPQEIQLVKNWISTLDRYVAHRDCLSVSFAVDFDCVDGNPDNARTDIAALRQRAKPYERAVTKDTINAADQLADVLLDAVEKITIYSVADAIVAMPPSRPKVEYSLPQHLAKRLSMKLGIEDLSQHAVTKADRPAIKSVARDLKLSALEGTITVDETAFKGRCCIIVDDLYQSGASMNYFAMLLQRAGAIGTLGLACEKTCRNDDNLLRRQ
jgi:predicted amidophosphoribosyltransferase